MTQPSRGQCDGSHVILPLYLCPSHLSPRILLMGSWELISPPLLSLLSPQGCENPAPRGKSSACPCHFLLPARPSPAALVHVLLPFLWQTTPDPVDPGAVPRAAPVPWEGSLPLHPMFCLSFHRCLNSCQIPSLAGL